MGKKKDKDKKKPWERSGGGQSWRRQGSSNKSSGRKKPFSPPKDDKKKKSGSGSGSKKVKKAGQRITESLQMQASQGNDRARSISRTKIERSPKNLGYTSGRTERKEAQDRIDSIQRQRDYSDWAKGIPSGLDSAGVKIALRGGKSWGPNDQARYDDYMRKKGIDGLKNDALVDPDRFGPLSDQYKAGMDMMSERVQGMTTQLKNQQDELNKQNQNEKALYLAEISRNHDMMRQLQANNQAQQQAMQAAAAADQRFRAEQLYQQNLMIQAQERQAAQAAALQAEQQRKASNLANAYVPQQQESLGSVTYGDSRTDSTATKKRKAKNNTISSLRMNTGLSKPSSSTAGLQLA